MEHGEVEGQSQSNWVAGVKRLRGGLGELVVLKGTVLDSVELISLSALSNVSVVITDHLVEEGLGLISAGNSHARSLHDVNNIDTLLIKLLLNLGLVGLKGIVELGVLWILLDGADGSNGGSFGSDLVLETDREKISLLSGEVVILGLDDLLQVGDHVIKPLGLLSNSSHKNMLFKTHSL